MASSAQLKRRLRLYSKSLVEFWGLYKSNRLALLGLGILLFFVILALFPTYLSPYDPRKMGTVEEHMNPPSWQHLFGTDDVGKDILSLVIHGSRTSLVIGFLASFVAVGIGTVAGITSGYYGGLKGELLMRVTDVFLVLPLLPLMILMAALLTPSIWNIIMAIGLTAWTSTARITRSMTLSLKQRTYVERARSIGCSDLRILRRHLLPTILPLVFANSVIVAAIAIASEAILSFLGLGDVNAISWGTILYFAFSRGSFTLGAYWYFLPPGICIVLVIVAFTMMGNGLDEILNPRLRRL